VRGGHQGERHLHQLREGDRRQWVAQSSQRNHQEEISQVRPEGDHGVDGSEGEEREPLHLQGSPRYARQDGSVSASVSQRQDSRRHRGEKSEEKK